jgi:hypothetical protein
VALHLTLHIDVKSESEAIKIAEQLSAQLIGFALSGHSTMLTIDEGYVDELREGSDGL